MVLKKSKQAQPVPKPAGHEPGYPPGNVPPVMPLEISTPTRTGAAQSLSDSESLFDSGICASALPSGSNGSGARGNLSSGSELEETTLASNDPRTQKWRIAMASIKPVEDAAQDFSADIAALRDDVTKLTSSVLEFIGSHAAATTTTVADAVDSAKQKISDTASKAQDRVAGTSADLESTIERNPLAAVLIALVAGLLVGLLSRGRK